MGVASGGLRKRARGGGPEEEGHQPNSISPLILVGIQCPRW